MALGPAVGLGARNGGVSGEVIERARSGPKTIAPSSSAKACLATEPVVLSRSALHDPSCLVHVTDPAPSTKPLREVPSPKLGP